jgi:hypothetical protein
MIVAKNKGFLLRDQEDHLVKLDFILEEDTEAVVELLDNENIPIKQLYNGSLNKGFNDIEVNLLNLESNTYYYRIKTKMEQITKILYIVKYINHL